MTNKMKGDVEESKKAKESHRVTCLCYTKLIFI